MKTCIRIAALALVVMACSSTAVGRASSFAFTISGEDSALDGFAFPPTSDEAAFVDGWELKFDRVLVTVGDIVLSESPDSSPGDQRITGPAVARARGPWAVDLTKSGTPVEPAPLTGRGSASDRSIRLTRIENQDLAGGKAFDPSARYAFGYDMLVASAAAERVNLDSEAARDYEEMIGKGWSVLYVGTATFKGTTCNTSSAADFSAVPTQVRFRFGFATPTQFLNCQNTDLTGKAFEGEEKQRGVQVKEGGVTYAQLTLHLEHPFFDTVAHDEAKVFFDPIAAAARNGQVTLEDLTSVDPSSFVLPGGAKMPWRSCIASTPPKMGDRRYDSGSTPLRTYAEYMQYNEGAMGHLNADGLCAVSRKYPSPP